MIQNNSKNKYLVLISGCVLIMTIVLVLFVGQKLFFPQQQPSQLPSAELPKSLSWNFPQGSRDPLMGYDYYWKWFAGSRLVSESVAQAAKPSAGCAKSMGLPFVQVPSQKLSEAFGGAPGQAPELLIEVNPAETCFTPGFGIWIIGVQQTTAGEYSPDAIWSRIQRIEKSTTENRVNLVTQFVGTPIYHWPSRVLPPFHPHARILHRRGLIESFSQLTQIVDVRPLNVQKMWPLPWTNVISIPYSADVASLMDAAADRTDARRQRHESLGDAWPKTQASSGSEISDWKKWERNSQILIVGQNPSDARAFRALIWLAEAGFKNLSWFYEGADAFYLPQNEVPLWSHSPQSISEHIPQVQNLVQSGQATLIDVRSPEEFKIIHHIKAINLPYTEKSIDGVPVLRGLESYDIFQVLNSGDQFSLDQIKDEPAGGGGDLFLMGADRYDWRTVKLYTRLRHRYPQRKISIVRDGIADFGLWQRIDRNLIQLVGDKAGEIH